jgi:hypothetical protein
MSFRGVVATLALLLSIGCSPRGPLFGSPAPEGTGGTIAGTVTDGTAALSARKVTAVETTSGARVEVATGSNGGYTIKVPKGTYRLEVELRRGEAVRTQPEETEVNVGDLDAGRDFVVGVGTAP